MANPQARPKKRSGENRSQISGARKDDFLRRAAREIPSLDEESAARVAEHLARLIEVIKADRGILERYRQPLFDPNAFSVMKVYRTSGEGGLRERLSKIAEARDLQALAKAQQISLPRHLRGKNADPAALKEAIVKGTARRHDDWRAAS
jgi:hypothetical protein